VAFQVPFSRACLPKRLREGKGEGNLGDEANEKRGIYESTTPAGK